MTMTMTATATTPLITLDLWYKPCTFWPKIIHQLFVLLSRLNSKTTSAKKAKLTFIRFHIIWVMNYALFFFLQPTINYQFLSFSFIWNLINLFTFFDVCRLVGICFGLLFSFLLYLRQCLIFFHFITLLVGCECCVWFFSRLAF